MGGSGRSGKLGEIRFPNYLELDHEKYLDDFGNDLPNFSMTDTFNTLYGTSVFTDVLAFNPDIHLTAMSDATTEYSHAVSIFDSAYVDAMRTASEIVDAVIQVPITETLSFDVNPEYIHAIVESFRNSQIRVLESHMLRLKRGARNIGASIITAYDISEQILRRFLDDDVTRFTSELILRLEEGRNAIEAKFLLDRNESTSNFNTQRNKMIQELTHTMISESLRQLELGFFDAKMRVDIGKASIVYGSEESLENIDISERDAKWTLDLYQPVANFMAGPSGGVTEAKKKESAKALSVLGGTLSGAALGASIGSIIPGIGTVVGAVVGAIIGLGLSLWQNYG